MFEAPLMSNLELEIHFLFVPPHMINMVADKKIDETNENSFLNV